MKQQNNRRIAYAMAGVAIGVTVGVAVNNLLLGSALSVVWGISFWLTSKPASPD